MYPLLAWMQLVVFIQRSSLAEILRINVNRSLTQHIRNNDKEQLNKQGSVIRRNWKFGLTIMVVPI